MLQSKAKQKKKSQKRRSFANRGLRLLFAGWLLLCQASVANETAAYSHGATAGNPGFVRPVASRNYDEERAYLALVKFWKPFEGNANQGPLGTSSLLANGVANTQLTLEKFAEIALRFHLSFEQIQKVVNDFYSDRPYLQEKTLGDADALLLAENKIKTQSRSLVGGSSELSHLSSRKAGFEN